MRAVRIIFLFIVLVVLVVPSLQSVFVVIKEPALKGYYHQSAPPSLKLFTWRKWFSSVFQDEFSVRLNDHAGYRFSLIRISNQYDFSLFGITHAKGFIRGKQDYLFEEDYIHEYTGEYFIGRAAIDKKLSRLKNVSDSLRAHHIPLLLVFEPGKASFYPGFIPSRFHPEKRALTNYDYMTRRSAELGISFLDLNRWFLMIKDSSRYPLFPRYGMHWSLYGVPFAVDTLARTIERATGRKLPSFTKTPLVESDIPIGTDNDIGELLNLACPLKSTPGGYPTIRFAPGQTGTLNALVIADSYYINIAETYGRGLFKSQDYWYYNRKMYPNQNNDPPEYVDKTNLRTKLESYGVILLMASEINLHCGFWNFADEAFLAFHPEVKDPLIYGIENTIRNEREWFRFMVNKSRIQSRPLEEMIREDAEYVFRTNYNDLQGKGYWDSVYHLAFDIKSDAAWFSQVKIKAQERNITVDSMLLLDAIYSYGESKKSH